MEHKLCYQSRNLERNPNYEKLSEKSTLLFFENKLS